MQSFRISLDNKLALKEFAANNFYEVARRSKDHEQRAKAWPEHFKDITEADQRKFNHTFLMALKYNLQAAQVAKAEMKDALASSESDYIDRKMRGGV